MMSEMLQHGASLAESSLVCLAYIGPGAGFAFIGSFLILVTAIVLALVSLFFLPLRLLLAAFLRKPVTGKRLAKRVIIVGLDGLDPRRVREGIGKNELPNFTALAQKGYFSELTTTCPPISPVAWSSFATGTNPGKHNIFDFLNRDLQTYIPELSSCRIHTEGRKPEIELLRKSKPFWSILGEHGIFSTILRVPITFPPERFNGLCLSAMCTPDLRGTQGTFTLYETDAPGNDEQASTGGLRIPVVLNGTRIRTMLPGPPTEKGRMEIPLTAEIQTDTQSVRITLSGQTLTLKPGTYSDWITVKFRKGTKRVQGICRLLLLSLDPFRLYVTPINIHPTAPVMPISHPPFYAAYLAKLQGPYATLGLAEDTWALSEGVLSPQAFLQQTYDIHREREVMFLEALKNTRQGVCCCVFDLADRVQHMFLNAPGETVAEAYRKLDELVGKVRAGLDDDTVLFVLSDHGFRPFLRGVNLNAWLRENGYLTLKPDAQGKDFLQDVDWSKTRAYTFGLSGIYLNLKGREANGIVEERERAAITAELTEKLRGLSDREKTAVAVAEVYDAQVVYQGPYTNNGPDLIIGYGEGYRADWEAAVGRTDGPVFSDNTKPWKGDHCMDYKLVPGVFFCNRQIDSQPAAPHITDLAPTILKIFGVDKPAYMDGKVLIKGIHIP